MAPIQGGMQCEMKLTHSYSPSSNRYILSTVYFKLVNMQLLYVLSLQICAVLAFNSCTSRRDVCHCLVVQTPMDNMSKNMPSSSMAHVAFRSKLCSVVRSSMPPYLRNWVAIRRVVVYYAWEAHAFSAGIKWRHCIFPVRHWMIWGLLFRFFWCE